MYQRHGLGLSLLILAHPAAASTLSVVPGQVIQAAPCTAKPSARCWARAQALYRFAAEAEAELAPVDLDVRLAWEGEDVLIKAKGLSADQHIEVVVSPGDKDTLAIAQLFTAKNGVTRHTLMPAPEPGQTRAARLSLRDASEASTRAWAPAVDGDLSRHAKLWFTAAPVPYPSLTVSEEDGQWTISAPPSTVLKVRHRRPLLPSGGKGISAPWETEVEANTPFEAPPNTGWFDIEGTRDDAGTQILSAGSVHWTAPASERLSNVGIHPAPKSVSIISDESYTLKSGATICAESDDLKFAGGWLKAELERLTGFELSASCSGEPDVTLSAPAEPLRHPEAFTIESRSAGVRVHATGRRGGLYGAIALADLIGFDGSAPEVDIEDWPTLDTRVLYHEVSPLAGPMVSPEQTMEFIDRVVSRSRINMMILELKGGYKSRVHPELSRNKGAWTQAELKAVLNRAREYGIEVIPAFNTPAHSRWIAAAHPELMEEETAVLLCTRHPGTRALTEAMYTELIDIFDQPRFVHIGHDEIGWRTHRKHEDQRCVRCEGTPRWQILAEDLMWHHETLARLGARPMMWSDMMVSGWHGKQDSMYRASNRIPEDIRPDFVLMSWGRTGDSVGNLVPKGYTVIRGNTGYADWKRQGLVPIAEGIAGEALALFNPTPWSSFEGMSGRTRLYHHWSNVMLAGATAWEPRLEETPIETSMLSLMNLPAYQPGYVAWPQPSKLKTFVARTEPAVKHGLKISDYFEVGEMRYSSGVFFKVEPEQSELYVFRKKVLGLSMVHAVSYAPSAQPGLAQDHNKTAHQQGVTVGSVVITYKDEQQVSIPLVLGMNTNRMDAPVRGSLLFDGAGTYRLASRQAAEFDKRIPDRALYRVDWHNPRPDAKLAEVEIKATHSDVTLWVAGIAMAVNPASEREDDE